MKINLTNNNNQSFKGITISKDMPKEIVKAIKTNPVIKKAGKNYSLRFNYTKSGISSKHYTSIYMSTPNIDSPFRLLTTPPHSIKREAQYLGQRTNGVLRKLEEIGNTPDFFEKKLGTPRTFKQKLQAFLEAWEIALMPSDRTVMQEVKLGKILDKYKNMNMPE